jgi:hypothetical protein
MTAIRLSIANKRRAPGISRLTAPLLFLAMAFLARAARPAEATVDFIIGASTPQARPFLRNGAVLWAILPAPEGYRLARRVAQVSTFEYRNAARGDETFTGQRLLGPGADRALIHLAGSLDLREGPVILDRSEHVLIDQTLGSENTPASPFSFRLGDRLFRVAAEVAAADRGYKSLRVLLEDGPRTQELVSSREATDPYAKLAWIGDIDRDGRPDFLLSVRFHYSVTSHRLYLSSLAEPGQLCRHVGTVDEEND